MADILTRAGCFIAIILLGMVLRRVGFFKQEDFYVLSKIVVKITLTAAIVKSFVGRELEPSMIILTLIGFGFGVLLGFALIFLTNRLLPFVEDAIIENARNMNIYVEFQTLDNLGDIIGRIKSQGGQIYEVDLDRGREERSKNPSAVFSIRLPSRHYHVRVLAAISELESVYTIDEI